MEFISSALSALQARLVLIEFRPEHSWYTHRAQNMWHLKQLFSQHITYCYGHTAEEEHKHAWENDKHPAEKTWLRTQPHKF